MAKILFGCFGIAACAKGLPDAPVGIHIDHDVGSVHDTGAVEDAFVDAVNTSTGTDAGRIDSTLDTGQGDANVCGAASLDRSPIYVDQRVCSPAIVACYRQATTDASRTSCIAPASEACGGCLQGAREACAVNGDAAPCRNQYACLAACIRDVCRGSTLANCEALARGVGGRCAAQQTSFDTCVSGTACGDSFATCAQDAAPLDAGVADAQRVDTSVPRESSVRDAAHDAVDARTDAGRVPRAFVTYDSRTGRWLATSALFAARQGDVICQDAADAGHLGGTWFALVTDASSSRHLTFSPAYNNLDGLPLFYMSGSTITAVRSMPYNITDEDGYYLSDSLDPTIVPVWIWTGGLTGAATADTCNDWTSQSSTWTGTVGDILSADNFRGFRERSCSSYAHLLCLER